MIATISEFRWHVFSGGYVCEDRTVDRKTTRVIGPNVLEHEAPLTERYPLEEDPGLFRKFAATELTEEAIISFANEWGPLRNAHDFGEEFLDPDLDEEGIVEFSWTLEPTALWFSAIKKMKALVGLCDVLKAGKDRKLSEVIELKGESKQKCWEGEITFKAAPELRWSFFFHEENRPAGTRELARMCLLYLVNDSLWAFCSPWLRMDRTLSETSLCLTPHNLEAALWLMFAQEILGNKQLKQCVYCKRYFEITQAEQERRQRSDKKYCSPKCRASAFRERREESPGETEPKKAKRRK